MALSVSSFKPRPSYQIFTGDKAKAVDFDKMMMAKFQARTKSQDYDPESSEDVRFIGWFESFIDKYKGVGGQL